jgi:predicted TIM-barrel fold metal-dependent hydrolase
LRLIRDTIESVERMQITTEEKRKIFQENAINLMRLPLGKF